MATDPGGIMERQLIEDYLKARGHTLRSVRALPEREGRPLLAAAAEYASLRLTEIEARAHYLDAIRGGADGER
jgi:hypothetical protein